MHCLIHFTHVSGNAFGGDLSQDPHLLALYYSSRGGLLATLDNILHGLEKYPETLCKRYFNTIVVV